MQSKHSDSHSNSPLCQSVARLTAAATFFGRFVGRIGIRYSEKAASFLAIIGIAMGDIEAGPLPSGADEIGLCAAVFGL